MRSRIFIVFLLAASLWGCRAQTAEQPAAPLCRVVTGISVEGPDSPQRYYSSPDKMRKVLHYLRLLEPLPPMDAAEQDSESICRITLHLSDGSTTVYQQKGSQFFRISEQPWQEIDPDQGAKLHSLLYAMPGDSQL